jgi:hypothetical protein
MLSKGFGDGPEVAGGSRCLHVGEGLALARLVGVSDDGDSGEMGRHDVADGIANQDAVSGLGTEYPVS